MAIIKDYGLVLREFPAGESNKRVVLLTQKHGKLTVFVRGSKKTNSKLTTGLFSYNELMIFDGGDFLSLNGVAPIHSFAKIAEDYEKYCFGCYFLELIDKMVLTGMETDAIMKILLHSLEALNLDRHTPATVFAVFTFKFLQKEGFAPLVTECASCGGALPINGGCCFTGEGLVCQSCSQTEKNSMRLPYAAKLALIYIMEVSGRKIFSFNISADAANQFKDAAMLFLDANVDAELKSLALLKC